MRKLITSCLALGVLAFAPALAIDEDILAVFGTTNYSTHLNDFEQNHSAQNPGSGHVIDPQTGDEIEIDWYRDDEGRVIILIDGVWQMCFADCTHPIQGGLHDAWLNVPPTPQKGTWAHKP